MGLVNLLHSNNFLIINACTVIKTLGVPTSSSACIVTPSPLALFENNGVYPLFTQDSGLSLRSVVLHLNQLLRNLKLFLSI